MMCPNGNEIEFVEWYRTDKVWRVVTVIAGRQHYSFQYCETTGETLWNNPGSGSPVIHPITKPKPIRTLVWSASGKFYDCDGNELTRKQLRQMGYSVTTVPPQDNPFDDAFEGRTEWCNACQSHVDEDNPCRHIHRGECGDFVLGAGGSSHDLEATRRSLFRILELMPDEAVQCLSDTLAARDFNGARHSDSILGGDCQFIFRSSGGTINLYFENLGREDNFETRIMPGMAWLHSLDKKTPEAIALTVGWIWAYLSIGFKSLPLYAEMSEQEFAAIAHNRLHGRMIHEPFTINRRQLSKSLNTTRFLTENSDCERIVLMHTNKGVAQSVAEFRVAEVIRKSKNEWEIHPGYLLTYRDANSSYDIRQEQKTLVATFYVKRRRKRR